MSKQAFIWLLVIIVVIGGIFLLANRDEEDPINIDTDENTDQGETATSSPTTTPATNTDTTNPPTTSDTIKEFTIDGSNFSYSPSEIRVNKGDTVRITFRNTGGFHDLVIDEFDVKTPQIQAGQTAVVEFVADQAGTFEYYCSVGNHRQMGMVGTLIVE